MRSAQPKNRPETWLRTPSAEPELAACFSWTGDRYAHRIFARIDGRELLVAQSVSSIEAEPAFLSPTFQDLSLEAIQNRDVLCMVGMSGSHYWSASVETTASPLGLVFDISCKGLGISAAQCAYDLGPTGFLDAAGNLVIQVSANWFCFVSVEQNSGRIEVRENRVTVLGSEGGPPRGASLRLKHRWRLATLNELPDVNKPTLLVPK